MEWLVGSERDNRYVASETHRFTAKGTNAEGETRFELELIPGFSGLQTYKLRLYPYHRLLTHRFETGLMKWI
jgi:glycogen phosphorylase